MKCLLIFSVVILHCYAADDLIVEIADGRVQGTTITSPNGQTFYTWRHIPFAKPPVGELRFQPPTYSDPWTDVLNGTDTSPACYFVGSFSTDPVPEHGYSEDCLYVNGILHYLPTLLNLPVMFYIYGGGFYTGTGDFAFLDPTPLLLENVIVVTFNYRLDIFGFLSTEDTLMPGNSGLKDQWFALIWTKSNIYNFGGNPLDITLFGESAGAMSVGYHLVSPMSRNLFQGAIMQSGSALMNYLQATPRDNAVAVASAIDSSINNDSTSEDVLKILQTADVDNLITISLSIRKNGVASFTPSLEPDNNIPFLSNPLYEELEAGNVSKIPVMMGTNSEEQLFFASAEAAASTGAYYDSNLTLLLPNNLNLKDGASSQDLAEEIKEAYAGNNTFEENPGAIVRYLSDNSFVRSSLKYAVLQAQYSPVYFYMFSFVGTLSAGHPDIPGAGKVAHAEDVGYLFNVSTKPIETDADYLNRARMVKLWTNFAKTKNPTPEDDSAELLQHVTWEQFDEDKLQYLNIGEDLVMEDGREAELTTFWKQVWETYATRPYNTY